VSASTLPLDDARALAQATARLGIMGEAAVLRSATVDAGLSPEDTKAFDVILSKAGSQLEKTFLYKALGAGHDLAAIATFADTIRGWSEEKLVHSLNLAAPTAADDGVQNGAKQQFLASCTATTAQMVRGELDPIYALEVRTANQDVHAVDDADPMKLNPAFATEQQHLLEVVGDGKATPRNGSLGGYGTWAIDKELSEQSAFTGFTYTRTRIADCDDVAQIDAALDAMAKQLELGIPTPLVVGSSPDPSGHCVLALAAEGSGADQKVLIHDPWEGTTAWWSRAQFEQGTLNLAGWTRLGYFYEAHAAPLGVVTPPEAPLEDPS
jgi:hypothetical protein